VTGAPRRFDQSTTPPVTLAQLVGVELRKSVDTASGRWALGAVLAAVPVALLLASGDARTFEEHVRAATLPQAVLLPVLGLVVVTSGWRTAAVTFAIVPSRSLAVLAELVAVLLLGLAAGAAAYGGAALATVLHGTGGFAGAAAPLALWALPALLGGLQGAAYGLLLLDAPAALVVLAATCAGWLVLGEVGPAELAWVGVAWLAVTLAGGWWRVLKTGIG
jgi:ABC-2 type transport system permease protein